MHRLTISLQDDVYELLKEDAQRNCRTLTEELTYMLRTRKGSNSPYPFNSTEQSPQPQYKKTVIG